MYVFEILTPGSWLDYEDREWAWSVSTQLGFLKSHFFEANAALNLFTSALSVGPPMSRQLWEQDAKRRSEIQRQIEHERIGSESAKDWLGIALEADLLLKREAWANGRRPREFAHQLPFVYAKAFLYALDVFDKFLGVLAKETGAMPTEVVTLHAQMAIEFPDLREVRNSTQHMEDRARGLGRGGKLLNLQPVDNEAIRAPSGALILNNLIGSRYGSTMADGHYGEVDVTPESMQRLQNILQSVLNAFNWTGPRQHEPSL